MPDTSTMHVVTHNVRSISTVLNLAHRHCQSGHQGLACCAGVPNTDQCKPSGVYEVNGGVLWVIKCRIHTTILEQHATCSQVAGRILPTVGSCQQASSWVCSAVPPFLAPGADGILGRVQVSLQLSLMCIWPWHVDRP